jgi:hypothetical protein
MRKALSICALLVISSLPVQFASAAGKKNVSGEQTLYGYISCSACGAKGATESHRECMEKCLAKGANIVLVTDGDNMLIPIDNPDTVSGQHAHRVALFGYTSGEAFHVISVRVF